MSGVTLSLALPSLAQSLAVAGWGLTLLGLGWVSWATHALKRAGVAIAPGAPPQRLVDDGPYAHSRHPMTLGLLLAVAGWALAAQAPGVAVAGVALALWLDRVHLPREEARLAQRFGGWWTDYAADVGRWW